MKQIKIDIPAGYEVDTENSDLPKGEIKFRKIKQKYPTEVDEIQGRRFYIDDSGTICEIHQNTETLSDPNNVSTEERAKAFLALMQLVELRDAYNRIDRAYGPPPKDSVRAVIRFTKDGLVRLIFSAAPAILSFDTMSTRDKFYENFKDLIEQAKELLT